ncbi:hypothetical protein Pyrfu_0177 [Pyrolobus fumarii 1A]|uniref:Exosome complex component Csl4 n=1 Tax=Pyrolobus fumarii (strain DSM 11204 / 1A) TaxID=694429 RepID=G0EET5_PYRF1|nr:exosome complex RNA-binding protein Csl4 [Pyrolobus fumarii]AEM38049.1 hypothetical protein Pyrfu_0177 [Pyrolobus fumarii 1A]
MSERRQELEKLHRSLVVPGEEICVIEEFVPGEGAYVLNGVVRSGVVGRVFLDWIQRRVSVINPVGKPRIPRRGSTVYGVVTALLREDLVLVKVFADERLRRYNGMYTGFLHVSQASDKPARSILEVVKPGDVIRARIVNAKHPFQLNIKLGNSGVVAALCSKCGAPLYRVPGQQPLVCLRCGSKENRKIATGYIYVKKGR